MAHETTATFRLNGTADQNRTRSPAIWHDCPWDRINSGEVDGVTLFDDFLSPYLTVPTSEGVYPPYAGFSSTGGTILPATAERHGIITLGSDGDDEGASIRQVGQPFKIIRGDGKLWFEARVKVDTIAVTKYDAFIGLGEKQTLTAAVPITATAGTLADKNLVGFLRPGTATTGDGSSLRITYKADGVTAVTVETVAGVFAADTYVKLGFTFDPKDYKLRFFIDNVERVTTYTVPSAAGTDFPNDVLLGVIAAVTNAAAVTSVFSIDWWRVAQVGTFQF